MFKYHNNIKADKEKNKPSIIAPVANTVFSGIGIIALVLAFILTDDFISTRLFICCLFVLLMFPISSWILSYLTKKQKVKTLNTYEDETKLIVEFMDSKKNYYTVHEDEKVKARAKIIESDQIGTYQYDKEKSSLGFLDSSKCYVATGVGFVSLEIDPESKIVTGIKGLLPKSIWLTKNIKTPLSIKGKVEITLSGVSLKEKTYVHINSRDDAFYNKKTGMLCVGDYHSYSLDEAVEFLDNAYLVIREGVIVSLWIYVGENINK